MNIRRLNKEFNKFVKKYELGNWDETVVKKNFFALCGIFLISRLWSIYKTKVTLYIYSDVLKTIKNEQNLVIDELKGSNIIDNEFLETRVIFLFR